MPPIVCQICEEAQRTSVFTIHPTCVHCGSTEFQPPGAPD